MILPRDEIDRQLRVSDATHAVRHGGLCDPRMSVL